MADITQNVADIRNALYGKEITESIAVGIEEINSEVVDTTARQSIVENTVAGAIATGGNPSLEVGEARKGEASLGDKIDKIDTNITNNKTEFTTFKDSTVSQLADMTTQLGLKNILDFKNQNKIEYNNKELLNVAVTTLNGSKIMATTPVIPIWTPDGTGAYGCLWTRDFAYMVDGTPDYFQSLEIENIFRYIATKCNMTTFEVPDHIDKDGNISWSAGSGGYGSWGTRAALDGNPFLVDILFQHFKKSNNTALYNEFKVFIKNIMDLGIPYNTINGLVSLPLDASVVTYGFWDTIRMTGDLNFLSVLAYQAYGQLAIMANANADSSDYTYFTDKCTQLKESINSVFWSETFIDNGTTRLKEGLLKASTGLCKEQPDIWGSCLAVFLGIPSDDKINAISNKMVHTYQNNKGDIFYNGGIRQVPKSQEFNTNIQCWESMIKTVVYGQYQSGGYWATPLPWVVDTMAYTNNTVASSLLEECINNQILRVGGALEWDSFDHGKGIAEYTANTTLPLLVIKNKIPNLSTNQKPNILIDGNFQVAQLTPIGTESYYSGAIKYPIFNIWKTKIQNYSSLPITISHSQQKLTQGELPLSTNFKRFSTSGDGGVISTDGYVMDSCFIHNGCNLYANGEDITVSFYARSSIPAKKIICNLCQIYDLTSSSADNLKGSFIELTNVWKKYIVTMKTINLTGKTVTSDNSLSIQFTYAFNYNICGLLTNLNITENLNKGAGNVDIAQVQVDLGSKALDFRPISYADELQNTYKYVYYDLHSANDRYANASMRVNTGTFMGFNLQLPVSMIRDPIVSIKGTKGTDWTVRDLANNINSSVILATDYPSGSTLNPAFCFGGTFTSGLNHIIECGTKNGYVFADCRY